MSQSKTEPVPPAAPLPVVSESQDSIDQVDDIEEEELDPRVQDELEKLNKHTDEINKLELQLEDANCLFRTLLTDSTHQLKALSQKIGKWR